MISDENNKIIEKNSYFFITYNIYLENYVNKCKNSKKDLGEKYHG